MTPATEKAAPIPAEDAVDTVASMLALNDGRKYVCGPDFDLAYKIVRALAERDRANRASQEERIREDERADALAQREAALMDCQYVAGAQAGWNCAQADNPNEAFAALIKSRDGRIAALKKARARLRGDAS